MSPFKLIYFEGCPSLPAVQAFLEELRIPLVLVCQDRLPPGDPDRGFSSPSIVDPFGELILGTELGGDDCGSCTFFALDRVRIKSLIDDSRRRQAP